MTDNKLMIGLKFECAPFTACKEETFLQDQKTVLQIQTG